MAMTTESFRASVLGLCNLAKASGLHEADAALSLMMTALALADRNTPQGCTRETFVKMAEVVHDRVRKALRAGPEA